MNQTNIVMNQTSIVTFARVSGVIFNPNINVPLGSQQNYFLKVGLQLINTSLLNKNDGGNNIFG